MRPLYILPTTAILFCLSHASAQHYYPGGLGNANLVVWLNAGNSTSVTQSAGLVSQWSDLSGHAYHFTQSTNAQKPVYGATSGPNSRPGIAFTASSQQYMSTPSLPSSVAFTSGVSSLTVVNLSAAISSGFPRVYDFGNGANNNCIWFGRFGTSNDLGYEGRTGATIAQTYTTTTPAIVNGTHTIHGTVNTLSAVAHYKAGATFTSGGTSGSTTFVPNTVTRSNNYIGRSNWAADEYYGGTMSEILFYNKALNTSERRILENYLSAAWALSVSSSYYTPPTSTTYATNLVGIGYTSVSDNFVTNASGSTDGLGFSSGTGATGILNTAGYVMAAHNKQANTLNNNITITNIGANLYKWNRSWNLQKTGGNSSGLITVNFNFDDYNGTTPNNTYSYAILYNASDGTFASGTNKLIAPPATFSGNTVSFPVNATKLVNGYYTLVWSTTIILPFVVRAPATTRQSDSPLLQLYPNPVVNVLHVTGGAMTGNSAIRIINTCGQVVKTAKQSVVGMMEIDMADLARGFYTADIYTGKASYKQKIIKR